MQRVSRALNEIGPQEFKRTAGLIQNGRGEERSVEDEREVRWQALCEQAAKEQDPERLMALVRDIIKLLDDKRKRETPQPAA